jgi:N-acetylmuramoyl-L-alanine amidase
MTAEQIEVIKTALAGKKILVIIDAGHGGNHPETGAYMTFPWDGKKYAFTKPDGSIDFEIREGVVNRAIADVFEELCKQIGLPTFKVYHEYLDRTNSVRAQLANRMAAQMRAKGVQDSILLSFHSNAFGMQPKGAGEAPQGWSVWTTRGSTKSDAFATVWLDEVKKEFDKEITYRQDLSDGDVDWEANFEILWSTEMPAVLVEQLFFTNKEDAKKLLDYKTQRRFALCALRALVAYLGVKV